MVKRKRKSIPRNSPPQRSSVYRGVTRLINSLIISNFDVFHFDFMFLCPLKLVAFIILF